MYCNITHVKERFSGTRIVLRNFLKHTLVGTHVEMDGKWSCKKFTAVLIIYSHKYNSNYNSLNAMNIYNRQDFLEKFKTVNVCSLNKQNSCSSCRYLENYWRRTSFNRVPKYRQNLFQRQQSK